MCIGRKGIERYARYYNLGGHWGGFGDSKLECGLTNEILYQSVSHTIATGGSRKAHDVQVAA